ncbi:MAG: 16S rRNA (guanine(527)-N(7))-methyltransferase RsmG [Pseudomonadota bacterium]|nr:16S rRNA (guanine(527)-N(7))-methyltransferase RsmG [Pseudomonadota bacterium]
MAPGQAAALLDYLALLSLWNRTYNLTAVREPSRMLGLHLVDCLGVVEPLRRQRAGSTKTSLLDVGSGGGLPGVVLAIMEPHSTVTCVDAVAKKTSFIRQVAATLRLPNLHAEHGRVESLLSGVLYDVVVARAFGSLTHFAQSTAHRLAEGGAWMAMKGKRPDLEIEAVSADIDVFHVEPLPLLASVGERCIVWMRPRVVYP